MPIFHRLRQSAGFTMIELLVVIAVIGVLATAVLSSLNPIEQINKGRDTRLRSNAAQLINAIDRFYSINEKYPWNVASYNPVLANDTLPTVVFPDDSLCNTTATHPTGMCTIGGANAPATAPTWLTALSTTQEVKLAFVNQLNTRSSTNTLYLVKPAGPTGEVSVCFQPSSKQFQLEALKGCIDRKSSMPAAACMGASYDATTTYSVANPELICLP